MSTQCPHEHIQYCPLYVIAHDGRHYALTCIRGVDDGPCEVERGKMDYAAAVEQVRRADPRMVAIVAFNEQNHEARAQRARNMRLAGVA